MVLSKEKNFYKAILSIVIPITFQNLISVSVNMADTIMLGTLGEIELSASSIGGQLFFILMVLLMGIGSGANVMCAQYFGKEDKININKILSLAYLLAILLSLSCLIIALFSSDPQPYRRRKSATKTLLCAGCSSCTVVQACCEHVTGSFLPIMEKGSLSHLYCITDSLQVQ